MRALAAIALVCGCSSREIVRLELPDLGASRSAIVAATSGSTRRAWAVALDAPAASALPALESEASIELALAAFEGPLTRLGLTGGELDLTLLDEGRALPPPLSSFEARVESSTASWHSVNDVPAVIGALRVPGPEGPCVELSLHTVALPIMQSPGVLLSIDDDRVLVGTHEGTFFFASRDAEPQRIASLDGLPGMAAWRAPDGEIWLFGRAGATARGTIERGFVRTSSAPILRDLVQVEPVPGDPRDLFVVSSYGDVFRYDGARWVTVLESRSSDTNTYFRSLVALTPTHFLITTDSEMVRRYRDGTITDESPATAAAAGETREIEALALIPDLGVVASTSFDGKFLFDRGDRRWRLLEGQSGGPGGLGVGADEMIVYRGGFWASGTAGANTQWYPEWGFCRPGAPFTNNPVVRSLRRGDELLVVADYDLIGDPPVLVWMAPR